MPDSNSFTRSKAGADNNVMSSRARIIEAVKNLDLESTKVFEKIRGGEVSRTQGRQSEFPGPERKNGTAPRRRKGVRSGEELVRPFGLGGSANHTCLSRTAVLYSGERPPYCNASLSRARGHRNYGRYLRRR